MTAPSDEPIGSPQEAISDLRTERDELLRRGEELADELRTHHQAHGWSGALAAWDALIDENYREIHGGMTTIGFTVGRAANYDAWLRDSPAPAKCGAYEGYDGGWIWRTAAQAQAFLASEPFARAFDLPPSEFSIYRLELLSGWAFDVSASPHPSDGVHRLLNDAPIVERVPMERVGSSERGYGEPIHYAAAICPKCGAAVPNPADYGHRCVVCGTAVRFQSLEDRLRAIEERLDDLAAWREHGQ